MSLDVVATSAQVWGMSAQLAAQARRMGAVPAFAAELLATWDRQHEDAVDYLEGVEQGGVWPFAIPLEPLLTVRTPRRAPSNIAVVATDGSQIDVDSHGLVHCFLINVGWAAIAYGDWPRAWLANRPTVHHQDEDVFEAADGEGLREAGDRQLGIVRTLAEIECLAEIALSWGAPAETVAMADGNLVRWELGGKGAAVGEGSAIGRFTSSLARFKAARVPVCSYISRPNAREVANMAALLAARDCDRGGQAGCVRCRGRTDRLCETMRVLPDRDLFAHLRPGEVTGLFRSLSPVLKLYAPGDEIVFCYMRLDDEMARLELPIWVAEAGLVDTVLAVVLDQCRRGRGYPVVLMEAHEQAVIHGAGREAFRQLVLDALHSQDLYAAVSGKRLSKDRRAV